MTEAVTAQLTAYLAECRPEVQAFVRQPEHLTELLTARKRTHPGRQKHPGGLALHTLQVIEKALELNQVSDRQEVIECVLLHDIHGCEALEALTPCQRLAIATTKGRAVYRDWRPTPCCRFVVLVLIADMWSAFLNETEACA